MPRVGNRYAGYPLRLTTTQPPKGPPLPAGPGRAGPGLLLSGCHPPSPLTAVLKLELQMDPKEFISIINGSRDTIAWVLSILFLFGLFTYAKSRAGSAHFIHDRIWRILGGKKNYDNHELQSESLKLSDYEKFNYNTGIRFPSYQSISKTLEWLRSTDIELEEIIRIKSYFNSHKIEIRKPRTKIINTLHYFSAIIFSLTLATLLLSGLPAALLSIKKTGTKILVYENHVASWNPFSWSITEDDCKNNKIPLNEHDNKVICEILSDKERNEYLEKTILTQRITAIFLVLEAGFFLILTTRAFVTAKEARKLRDRSLQTPNQEGGQSPNELPTHTT